MAKNENIKDLFKSQELEKSINEILSGKFKIETLNKFQLKSNLIRIFLSSTFTGNIYVYNFVYLFFVNISTCL
jgi:hypothetical protein